MSSFDIETMRKEFPGETDEKAAELFAKINRVQRAIPGFFGNQY